MTQAGPETRRSRAAADQSRVGFRGRVRCLPSFKSVWAVEQNPDKPREGQNCKLATICILRTK